MTAKMPAAREADGPQLPSREAPSRGLSRAVVLGFGILLVQIGAGLPAPLYPAYQERFDLSAAQLTGFFVALVAGIVIALVLIGSRAVLLGHRTVLWVSCALAAVASACFIPVLSDSAPADPVWLIVVGHLASGLAIGGFSGVAPVAMNDVRPPGGTQTVGRLVAAGNAVGLAAGPLWSGLLLEFAPWPERFVFVVQLGLTLLLAGLLAYAVPPGGPATGSAGKPDLRNLVAVDGPDRRPVWLFSAAGCCAFAIGGVYSSLGAVVARDLFDVRSETLLGLVVTILFATNAVAGVTLPRLAPRAPASLGLLLITVGLVIVAAAPYQNSAAVFLTGTVIAGAGQGVAIAAGTAKIAHVGNRAGRATTMTATFFLVCYLGTAGAAFGIGAAASVIGLRAGLTVAALLIAFASLVLMLMIRRGPERRP